MIKNGELLNMLLKSSNLVRPLTSFIAIFFIQLMLFSASAASNARQPIIEEPAAASTPVSDFIAYENQAEGFKMLYHKHFKPSNNYGGVIAFVNKNNKGLRLIPMIIVSKYFTPSSQSFMEQVNIMEKKSETNTYYKLISVYKPGPERAILTRKFVDNNIRENIYEVSLYERYADTLFEVSYQLPAYLANSEFASRFFKSLESFKCGSEKIFQPEINAGSPALETSENLIKVTGLVSEGRFLEALSILKPLQKVHPENHELYMLIGKCHIGLKDYSRASACYKSLTSSRPQNLEMRNLYVDALILEKNYKQALAECKKALDLVGSAHDMASAYLNLGNIFFNMKKYEESLNSYTEGISKFPSNAKLYNNAATASIKLNDMESAKTYLERAISLDPKYVIAHLGMARLYLSEKKYPEAIFHYTEALISAPDCLEAYVSLADIYKKTNMPEKLEKLLSELKTRNSSLYVKVKAELK